MKTLDGNPIILPKVTRKGDMPWAAICKKDDNGDTYTITFVATDSHAWGIRDMNIGYHYKEDEVHGQLVEVSEAEAIKVWKLLLEPYYGNHSFRDEKRPLYSVQDFPQAPSRCALTVDESLALNKIVREEARPVKVTST